MVPSIVQMPHDAMADLESVVQTVEQPAGAASDAEKKERRQMHKLYQDESVLSFFRRLAFTADGSLLMAPSATFKSADGEDSFGVWLYARGALHR